jgi:hypothetical protein
MAFVRSKLENIADREEIREKQSKGKVWVLRRSSEERH